MNIKKIGSGVAKGVGGLLGLAVLIAWSGGCFGHKTAPGKVAFEEGFAFPAGAAVYRVAVTQQAARVDVVGTVKSEMEIHLSSRLSAYVSGVHASAGDRVTKGQVLVTLDDRELKEQLAGARAQQAQAEAEFARVTKLLEARAATEQALTAAKSAFDGASAQVKSIDVMLTFTEIRSPIDGRVTDRRIETGDLANPGQVLLSVYDPVRLRLEAAVPVRLIERLGMEKSVDVQLDRPNRLLKGRVSGVVGEVDSMSRTQIAKVSLDEAGDVLPGTFGRLWIYEEPRAVMLAPSSSVYRVGQLEYVQVRKGDRVVRRLVKTGPGDGSFVEVLSGLSAGDSVLLNPVMTGDGKEG